MTIRAVIVYALLFVAALIGAYVSWTQEPQRETPEGVVLVDAEPEEIAKIRYESEEIDVTLEPREDELGEYLWVSTTRKKSRPPANPHARPDEEDAKTDEVEEAAFKAGKTGDKLLEDLAPFRVARSLEVSKEELEQFGFDDPQGKLIVETKKGEKKTFEIGKTAYGFKNLYLRDADSGDVYVIKNSVVSPLERADSRLPEKQLFPVERSDVKQVAITTSDGQSLEFVQRNRDDAQAATWTKPGSDESNPTAESWLDKVFRLRASDYVAEGDEPAGLESVFAVKVLPADGEPATMQVLRGGTGEDGQMNWYARSDYARGLVELNGNLASDAAEDLTTLFETGVE